MRADANLPSDYKEKALSINKGTFCQWAKELGFAQTAFCSAEPFLTEKNRVEAQEPLAERRQLRYFPLEDEPKGKSLAVMLFPYSPAKLLQGEALFVDSYYQASNAAYHAAKKLEGRLCEAGCFAKANVSYPAKAAAVRAGMGWIGKNDLLCTEQYGTRVVIILMLTDLESDESRSDKSAAHGGCLNCGLCAKVCPSGALDERGMSHPQRCMRNYMMEGVVVPEHLRERMGMRLIGCDLCQRVCPMQPELTERENGYYELSRFMTEEQSEFSEAVSGLAEEIGRNTARPQRVRAQAALLAGNSGNATYLPALRQWMQSPFEAVKVHAQWAVERLELIHTKE